MTGVVRRVVGALLDGAVQLAGQLTVGHELHGLDAGVGGDRRQQRGEVPFLVRNDVGAGLVRVDHQDGVLVDALVGIVALGGDVEHAVGAHGDALGVRASRRRVLRVTDEPHPLARLPARRHGGGVGVHVPLPQGAGAVVDAPQDAGVGAGRLVVQPRGVLLGGHVNHGGVLATRPREHAATVDGGGRGGAGGGGAAVIGGAQGQARLHEPVAAPAPAGHAVGRVGVTINQSAVRGEQPCCVPIAQTEAEPVALLEDQVAASLDHGARRQGQVAGVVVVLEDVAGQVYVGAAAVEQLDGVSASAGGLDLVDQHRGQRAVVGGVLGGLRGVGETADAIRAASQAGR